MILELQRAAYAVLMPALSGMELSSDTRRYLRRGGVSMLLGETRDEYLARNMSYERKLREARAQFLGIAKAARAFAGAPMLVAVDQELGGIKRLHGLVPGMPGADALRGMSAQDIEARSYELGSCARAMGVNMFLAPIVDVVTGTHPWLHNRNLGADPDEVSRIGCAFIRGVQRAGVIATAKHLPGHYRTEQDQAIECSLVPACADGLGVRQNVLRLVIDTGVQAVMPGPAVFPALDPLHSVSTSARIIGMLRDHLQFDGLIISDDLDAVSILHGNSIADTAVAALSAGAHLLLVSSESGLDDIAQAIVDAVCSGRLEKHRLLDAAHKVRRTAQRAHDQVESGLYVSYPIWGGHLTRRVTC